MGKLGSDEHFARPVALVFEVDRLVVVTANELQSDALAKASPLARETGLDLARWKFVEDLARADASVPLLSALASWVKLYTHLSGARWRVAWRARPQPRRSIPPRSRPGPGPTIRSARCREPRC